MIFLAILFITAFLISSVSAYFSISGLTAIFPNAAIPIVSMGIVLEMGKLVTASFVYQYWNKQKVLARSVLLTMTLVLSVLSSVGVYGYLSRKHIEGTSGLASGGEEISLVQTQIDMEQSNITFLQQSLAQGDKVVNNYLSDTSKTIRAEAARTRLLRERQQTQAQIAASNKTLLTLQRQKDSLSQIQRVKEVDVGPLKYLAALISPETNIDTVVRWFILTLVFVLDPLAILLVIAGNIHRREIQAKAVIDPIQPIAVIDPEKPTPPPLHDLKEGDVSFFEPVSEKSEIPEKKELDFRTDEKWIAKAP